LGRKTNRLALTLVFILCMIWFFANNTDPALQITTEYLNLLPSMILLVITLFAVKNSYGYPQVGAWFFVGVALAFLASALNTAGTIVPTWLVNMGCTLQYLQVLLIILSTGVGILFMRD
jgi:hypothetical protein